MMTKRLKFRWVDPESGKKYKLDVLPDFKRVLNNVIETEEQAENFFAAYAKCCDDEKQTEHNIGYIAGLIKDKDIRDDILDLFVVDEQIEPIQLFSKPYRFSRRD